MTRPIYRLFCASALLIASSQANATTPKTAINIDYFASDKPMAGITIAPYHHDRNYADWGYYLGYALSKKETLDVTYPEEAYITNTLWRFGLSYSISDRFNLYAGTGVLINEHSYTNNITPLSADAQPIWDRTKETTVGGELGFRTFIGDSLVIGLGYNTATKSGLISLGYYQ